MLGLQKEISGSVPRLADALSKSFGDAVDDDNFNDFLDFDYFGLAREIEEF
jgi:hypothetical protein